MAFRRALTIGFAGFVAIFAAALALIAALPKQPVNSTKVTVTGIFDVSSQYSQLADITFRSDDGIVGSFTLPSDAVGCKIGDVVTAKRRGVSLSLDSSGCRKTPS
jgi:hypothetical protein